MSITKTTIRLLLTPSTARRRLFGEKPTSSLRPRELTASVTLCGAVYWILGTIQGLSGGFIAVDGKRKNGRGFLRGHQRMFTITAASTPRKTVCRISWSANIGQPLWSRKIAHENRSEERR